MIINPRYDGVLNVQFNFESYFKLLLNKCVSIFKWDGLPENIDEHFLMEQLVLNGKLCWFKDGSKYYALNGSIGGEPNVYYEPQNFIVANPILGSKTLRIRNKDGSNDISKLDGILMALTDWDYNSSEAWKGGLYHIIYKYAGLLADNDVSINCAQINGRLSTLFTADSEATARTGEKILQDIYAGKPYRVIDQDIVEKFNATPIAQAGTNNTIMSLIEAHGYILQNFYAEIGIASQGNLKRERVNTAETELMTGCLDINIYNMLKSLKQAVDQINEKWELNVVVELNDEVFYAGSQNATLGEEEQIEELDAIPGAELGAVEEGAEPQSDGELQIDGVEEDEIPSEPEESPNSTAAIEDNEINDSDSDKEDED